MNDEFNQTTPEQHNDQEVEQKTAAHDELTVCKSERDAWKEKFMRVQADLDNFSKRIDKERLQWRNTSQAAVISDILAIVDDFDRALAQNNAANQDMHSWLAGFEMIRKSFAKFLDKYEVKEISASMPFNPEYHEALVQVESPAHKSGEVVAVLQNGYTFRGTVLRPAKVSVAK